MTAAVYPCLSSDDSQMYLTAWIGLLCLHSLEVKARAIQAAGAGKVLVPIREKLKGSWSEMFSSELQFQPLCFPFFCFNSTKQKEGLPSCLPPTSWHGMLLPKGRAMDFLWIREVGENPTQPSKPSCLPCALHASLPLQGKSFQFMNPRLNCPTFHWLRERKRFF